MLSVSFTALTLSVALQKQHPASKTSVPLIPTKLFFQSRQKKKNDKEAKHTFTRKTAVEIGVDVSLLAPSSLSLPAILLLMYCSLMVYCYE